MVENEPDNIQLVLQKWQRTRRIQRKNINKLFDRAESYVNSTPRTTTESIEIEASCVLESLRDLEITNIECDREIQKIITDETELERDLEESLEFSLKIKRYKKRLENVLRQEGKIKVEGATLTETEERDGMAKAAVKLPKIEIKCFSGDYTCWKSFKETFEATVHRRADLTNIEKFTYLRSLLKKTASQAIEGFPLTADNYTAAWRLLNERFGNEQIIISNHMNNILNISPVYSPNVRSLRELYDNVESNVRALENLGVSYEQFGSLLIPIILEKLPNMIKLQISRKLGRDNWNVQDFLACINEEILARENYEYLKRENFEDPKPTSTFFTSANVKCCVFCKKDNHYSNQCKIITDVKLRCEFLKKNNLCFNCFKSGHSKKN